MTRKILSLALIGGALFVPQAEARPSPSKQDARQATKVWVKREARDMALTLGMTSWRSWTEPARECKRRQRFTYCDYDITMYYHGDKAQCFGTARVSPARRVRDTGNQYCVS